MPEVVYDDAGKHREYHHQKRALMPGEKRQMLLACGSRDNWSKRELHFVQGVCANDDKQHEELSQLHYQTLPHGDVSEFINNKCKSKENRKDLGGDDENGNVS